MSESVGALRWRDELLQIMYWYRGEGLGESVAPRDLVVFLGADEATVATHLDLLVADGFADEEMPGQFRLTPRGIAEGGRRFADEFAGLTGQAHGECNNPGCACHTLGPQACTSHTAHAH